MNLIEIIFLCAVCSSVAFFAGLVCEHGATARKLKQLSKIHKTFFIRGRFYKVEDVTDELR